MDEAIDVIKKQFSSFEGCELHSLSYSISMMRAIMRIILPG